MLVCGCDPDCDTVTECLPQHQVCVSLLLMNRVIPATLNWKVSGYYRKNDGHGDCTRRTTSNRYRCASAQFVPRFDSSHPLLSTTHLTDTISDMNSTHGACPATTLSSFIQAALDEKRITPEVLTRELKALHRTIQRPLKKIPPPSSAPGHTRREEAVDRRLTSIASAITNLARRIGMERQAVRAFMRTLKPYLRTIIVTIGMSVLATLIIDRRCQPVA